MTRLSFHPLRMLLAAAAIAAAAACGSTVGPDDFSGTDVRIVGGDSLFAGINRSYSGLTDSATSVVRTSAEWSTLWARATSRQQPAPATPAVDFSKQMVLVVAMGGRGTGGYGVSIDRITDTDGGARVVESALTHPVGCVVTLALTAPFAAVLAPATDAPVRFINHAVEHRCR